MNPKVLKELTEKTRALIDAPTCSSETKEAAKRWLDAVGTDAEAEETKKYIAELEEDIMPIDTLIETLTLRMAEAAGELRYEDAAKIRDTIKKLKLIQ